MKKHLLSQLLLTLLVISCFAPLLSLMDFASAASANFGTISTSGMGESLLDTEDIYGNVVTAPTTIHSAYVQNISFYGCAWTGTITAKGVLINNSTLEILGVTTALDSISTSYKWRTMSFSSPVEITGGTTYIIGLIPSAEGLIFRKDSGASIWDGSNSYNSPTDPTDGTRQSYTYAIYASYEAFNVSLSTNVPGLVADITVDSTEYTTPDNTLGLAGTHTFTAESVIVSGSLRYSFDHWLFDGSDSYSTSTVNYEVTDDITAVAYYTIIDAVYLRGPYSESTGLLLSENVTVTVHYSETDTPNDSFTLSDGDHAFTPSGTVLYFHYLFSDNSTREYWVGPSETTEIFYVYRDTTLTDYTLNFMDYTSVLATYPYVTAQTYVNGSYASVEKVKVDEENTFVMHLAEGTRYQFLIGNEDYTYVYGDVLMTDSTTVQLILKGTDFPKETLLMYPYLTLYANRTFVSGSDAPIIIRYLDSKDETLNFTITFTDQNGVNAYTYTVASSDITLTWNSAVDTNSYTVSVEIEHTTYGSYTWKQYLQAEGGAPVNLDLSFLGSWSIDLTYFIPIILIVIVAGCFSAMNAEVGAIVAAILAIILTYMGWIPIAPGLLVTALSLAILMALVYNKRRIQPY